MVIIKAKNNTRTDIAIRKTEIIAMMETDITRIREIRSTIRIKSMIKITKKIKVITIKKQEREIQTAVIKVTDLEVRRITIEEVKAIEAVM